MPSEKVDWGKILEIFKIVFLCGKTCVLLRHRNIWYVILLSMFFCIINLSGFRKFNL